MRAVSAGAFVVCFALLTGCGTQQVAVEPMSASESVAAESEVNEIYLSIWGTSEQQNAARYLGWREMTDPIAECMAGRSLDYYRYFVPIGRTAVPGQTEEWIGPLNLRQSDLALANAAEINQEQRGGEGPAWVNTEQYRGALLACEAEMGDPSKYDPPRSVEELSAKFRKVLTSVDHSLGPIGAYNQCMSARGYDISSEGDGAAGLSKFLRARMPLPPLPDKEPTPTWQEYLVFEHEVLSADSDCRATKHYEGIAKLVPEVDRFADEQNDALVTVREQWHKYLGQARAMGFGDPDGIN